MLKKNYKGRCEKRTLNKSNDVCRFYSSIQSRCGDYLNRDEEIEEIFCNRPIEVELGEYTTDFFCKKTDGSYLVRECIQKKFLLKPKTVRELDASREYWRRHGVEDWGLCVEKEDGDE